METRMAHYRMGEMPTITEIGEPAWNALITVQTHANPFLSFAFLQALEQTGCATEKTGWKPHYLTVWRESTLVAAMPLYEKTHSYGEYVFDWAWANAYHQHGVPYYPKLLSAIPFTPVTGNRLLSCDAHASTLLLDALVKLRSNGQFSSTHILFPTVAEIEHLQQAGFLLRQGVQFHWINQNYQHFDDFLASLSFKKRKNIRAERRKVQEAGVHFVSIAGKDITHADWVFFTRCYERTYLEHRSSPYLNLDFFEQIGRSMPQHLQLIIAKRADVAIASALLVHDEKRLFGRYWGCLEQISCLHFETAYYQAIEFCIAKKIPVFEGGAQGEHKMARGFLPHKTHSAHFLNEPAFADAIARFLEREHGGVEMYIDELNERTPFRSST